jgi:hypothetical protein
MSNQEICNDTCEILKKKKTKNKNKSKKQKKKDRHTAEQSVIRQNKAPYNRTECLIVEQSVL